MNCQGPADYSRKTGCNLKFKISNSKSQTNSKFQIPNEFFFSIFCARSAHESTKARRHEGARSVLFNLQSRGDRVGDMVVDDREHLIQEEKKKIRRLRVLVDFDHQCSLPGCRSDSGRGATTSAGSRESHFEDVSR